MKSEDMKMEKFKLLVRDIENYLGKSVLVRRKIEEDNGKVKILHPLLYLIEKKEKDIWLDSVVENTLVWGVDCGQFKGGKIILDYIEENNIMQLITEVRTCSNKCGKAQRCNASSKLLFWLIFAISIDNENYNNNLNVVADTAFLLGFDEEELGDWITAVKGVLSGKKLYEIEYKTEAGRGYFVRNENRY